MKRRASVLLADDHSLVADLLAHHLEGSPDLRIVASVSNATQAEEEAKRLHPDVAVLDIDMPGRSVFEAIRSIRQSSSGTRIIILTAYCSDHYVQQALELEVAGYVTKDEPLETVVEVIRKVASGGVFFSEEFQSRIVVHSRGASLEGPRSSRLDLLTNRETEVLEYIARGLSKKEIAAMLGISAKTVDQHCTHLMTKLDLHDRVALARFAIREGLARP